MAEIDDALREFVRSRAGSLCEYCLVSEQSTLSQHEIDHVIATKHGGRTLAENLAFCCAVCNRFKGSDIASIDPENGQLTALFHPRLDRWENHFELRNGSIIGLTAKGRVTIMLLRMNRSARIKERQLMQL